MVDYFIQLVFAAVVVEGIIFYVKQANKKTLDRACVASIIIGIFVGVAFELDVFAYFEMSSIVPYAGNVMTGILLSRGSNYFSDIISRKGVG